MVNSRTFFQTAGNSTNNLCITPLGKIGGWPTAYFLLLTTWKVFGQTDTTFEKADHYKTKQFNVAIFPSNYFDLIPGKRFTPTRQEIDQAEISLATNIKTLNNQMVNQSSTPIIHKNLHKYKRQYFGYIDKNGYRILIINCFWAKDKDDTDNWLKARIMVLDGGSHY